MTFSNEWEERYVANTHLSVWPWSDIVSLVHRHCIPNFSERWQVLELGCGAGANLPLFQALGIEYYGIDGSPTIIRQLHERYPEIKNKIICADFTSELPFLDQFDLILDRASLTHNNTASIKRTLKLVYNSLKTGGIFIGTDWFSKNHSDFKNGEPAVDSHTRFNYTEGQFLGVGQVHFSDEAHVRELFSNFEIILMEEKLIRRFEPKDSHQFASWNIVARKIDA